MTALILKKTASIYGIGGGNDYTVLDGDRVIGRIFLSPQLPAPIVRLSCEKCGRSGQYRKPKLIEHYGADIRLPDLREEIAKCGRQGQMHDMCGVHYVGLTG